MMRIGLVFFALLWTASASANHELSENCNSYAIVKDMLTIRYGETKSSVALQANGKLLEIYISRQKDTWTAITITPERWACIVAAGESWKFFNMDPAT